MPTSEWLKSKAVFLAALDLPAAERKGFVEQSCADDPSLLEAVLDLLAEHSETGSPGLSSAPPVYAEAVFRPGDLVGGRFRIIRFIARGGMGEVYEAEDERLRNKRIALKTLRLELAGAEDALERFRREIVIARDVAHENLCRVYDLVEHPTDDGSVPGGARVWPCLTMELVRGESLAEYLRRNRPLPVDKALTIAREIAAGISALHAHGIIHRDLKPSNIMLTPRRDESFRVVLMDFGLAKTGDTEFDLFESRVSVQAGAPFFMAPELFGNGEPSIASDIYSFGVVLDEMVTTSRMFSAASVQALIYAKLRESPTLPSQRSVDLPPRWEQAILRCLDMDPSKRFAMAADVVRALECEVVETVEPSRVVVAPPVRVHSRMPRRRVVMVAAGVPSMLMLGAAGNAFLHTSGVTIQVFNFDSGGLEEEYGYLCRGTANEVIRRLSEIDGVRVIPVRSTRAKASDYKPSTLLLDGMVQAHEGQLRLSITVQAEDGAVVWAGSFDRGGFANPLDMQAEIAAQTAAAVRRKLTSPSENWTGALRARLFGNTVQPASAPTASNAALDNFMRARYLMEEGSQSTIQDAIRFLREAVRLDPGFALAWAGLADAYILVSGNMTGNDSLLNTARACAEQAVRLAPGLAEAHASLGAVRQASWDWTGAEESYREALRIRPQFVRAQRWYAGFLMQFGRTEEALRHTRASLELDPYDKLGVTSLGLYLLLAGRQEEGIRLMEPVAKTSDSIMLNRNLGESYARMAQLTTGATRQMWFERAFAQAARVAAVEQRQPVKPRPARADIMYALFHSLAGNSAAAEPHLRNMLQDMQDGLLSPAMVAWIYTAQHNYSAALDLLERAAQRRDRALLYMRLIPFLEELRSTPRFQKLLQDLQL